jgi:hypothetical protein
MVSKNLATLDNTTLEVKYVSMGDGVFELLQLENSFKFNSQRG